MPPVPVDRRGRLGARPMAIGFAPIGGGGLGGRRGAALVAPKRTGGRPAQVLPDLRPRARARTAYRPVLLGVRISHRGPGLAGPLERGPRRLGFPRAARA